MFISTDYKITNFNEELGQITIQFNELNYPLNLDLHLDKNGHYLEGDALDRYIRGIFPVGNLQRSNKIAAGVPNVESIRVLVEPEPEVTPPASAITDSTNPTLTESQNFELRVATIAHKVVNEFLGATV